MKTALIFILTLFSLGLKAQDTLILSVKPDKIKIGEQTQFTIRYQYEGDEEFRDMQWPEFGDTISSKIEILEKGKVKTKKISDPQRPNLLEKNQTFTITSFDSGYYAIPPIQMIVNGDTLTSNPVLLEVHTVDVDTTKNFKDIKDIYETELSLSDYFKMIGNWLKDNWIYLFAVLVIILFLVYYFFLRKRNKPAEEKPLVIIPPHLITLEQLALLENKKLWQNGMVKEYYIELSDILRSYIEKRFLIHAMEQTTDEIMSQLRLTDISEISKLTLIPVLKLADLVKFAKENPIGTENDEMILRARDFVTSTIPVSKNNKKEEQ